jgi:hypothetical protein
MSVVTPIATLLFGAAKRREGPCADIRPRFRSIVTSPMMPIVVVFRCNLVSPPPTVEHDGVKLNRHRTLGDCIGRLLVFIAVISRLLR